MEEVSKSSENDVADLDRDTNVSPTSKMNKAPKAGEGAPQEALKLWRENGFSR